MSISHRAEKRNGKLDRKRPVRVTAFVDWNTQIHNARTKNLAPLDCAHKTLDKTTEAIFRALARHHPTRFVVSFRLYHGWHKGWEPTDNLRAVVNAVAEREPAESRNAILATDVQYGHTLLSALPRRLTDRNIHLPDTLRQRGRHLPREEKMVDTAIASDLLYWTFSDLEDWALVLSDDDDVIPPILTAEARTHGTDRRVFILKSRRTSNLIDLRDLLLEP